MKKIRVVVVDDNFVSRRLPSYILRPFGMNIQVLECASGDEALCLIDTHQITHLLLDISMPGMDGIKVAKKIRSSSKYLEIRLIAYTADALAKDVVHLKSVGFDDVLLKPLNRERLLEALGILTP